MTFRFNWKVSLFCAVFLVAFVNLGFWQLNREVEKRGIIKERDELRDSTPRSSLELVEELADLKKLQGIPVRLEGSFDKELVLLQDNRILAGQVGFEVLQVFHDKHGSFIVNRGFLPMGRTRDELPDVPSVPENIVVTGQLHLPGDVMVLKEYDPGYTYPAVIQSLDFDWLIRGGIDVFPAVVRLGESQPGALPRHWPDVVMQPEQHRGYAVQWFAMAVAISLAWFFFSFRKEDK